MQLHRGGRWRAWLGARFGGGAELGDRIWRRCLHVLGAFVLVYFLLPAHFFWLVPNVDVLLLALAVVLALEGLRLRGHLDVPTIRPFERARVASFAYFAVALVLAVLAFPKPIAVAIVLGAAIVDPMIGELRLRPKAARLYPALPLVAYGLLAFGALRGVGNWSLGGALLGGTLGALVGVASERPRWPYLDDDLLMTIVPGVFLAVFWVLVPGLSTWAG